MSLKVIVPKKKRLKTKKKLKIKKRFKIKKESKSKGKLWLYLSIIFILMLTLYSIRKVSSVEIDDVHPSIPCEQELIKDSDILWVVPLFQNSSISNYKKWCQNILFLNKTLGLHGVYHTHKEFKENIDENYLEEGMNKFKDCFGYSPVLFKPPQLSISKENRELLKSKDIIVKSRANQVFHKVYHCSDRGLIPNKIISLF